jgi:hypothetical protein
MLTGAAYALTGNEHVLDIFLFKKKKQKKTPWYLYPSTDHRETFVERHFVSFQT